MTVRFWHDIYPRPLYITAWLGRRVFRFGWTSRSFHKPWLSRVTDHNEGYSLAVEVYGFIFYAGSK